MSSFSSLRYVTFQLIVPCCAVSCLLQTNFPTFLFLAIRVVIGCVFLSDSCYRYLRSGLILLNKADPADVSTCPVCCMRALMSCRFLSTLLRLLIFLVGDGDTSGDVVGDAVSDDAGVVVLGVIDPCCPATISALMFSIIRCCFSRCCMSNFAILFLFVLHSSAIWWVSCWFCFTDTCLLSLIPGALYIARLVSILGCFCCGCCGWASGISGCGWGSSWLLSVSWLLC
jgi:hypothetical protein